MVRPSSGQNMVRPSSGQNMVRPSSGQNMVRPSSGQNVRNMQRLLLQKRHYVVLKGNMDNTMHEA